MKKQEIKQSFASRKQVAATAEKRVGASMMRLMTSTETAQVSGAYSGPSKRGAGH